MKSTVVNEILSRIFSNELASVSNVVAVLLTLSCRALVGICYESLCGRFGAFPGVLLGVDGSKLPVLILHV